MLGKSFVCTITFSEKNIKNNKNSGIFLEGQDIHLKHKYPVAHGILPSKPTEQLGEIIGANEEGIRFGTWKIPKPGKTEVPGSTPRHPGKYTLED